MDGIDRLFRGYIFERDLELWDEKVRLQNKLWECGFDGRSSPLSQPSQLADNMNKTTTPDYTEILQ